MGYMTYYLNPSVCMDFHVLNEVVFVLGYIHMIPYINPSGHMDFYLLIVVFGMGYMTYYLNLCVNGLLLPV